MQSSGKVRLAHGVAQGNEKEDTHSRGHQRPPLGICESWGQTRQVFLSGIGGMCRRGTVLRPTLGFSSAGPCGEPGESHLAFPSWSRGFFTHKDSASLPG